VHAVTSPCSVVAISSVIVLLGCCCIQRVLYLVTFVLFSKLRFVQPYCACLYLLLFSIPAPVV
jgi:hypothetical protein